MNTLTKKNLLLLSLISSGNLMAATTWTGTIDSDFNNAGNWDNGAPGSNDPDAIINNGDTVILSSNYTGTNPYTIRVDGNSTLNASADFTSIGLNIRAGSTVNLTGGNFTLPRTSGPGNGSGLNATGDLNITGGTHYFDERTTGTGTISITGSAPNVSFHQIGNPLLTFDLTLDAAGINTVTGVGSFPWFSFTNATLNLDASAYAGGAGIITLFDSHDAGSPFLAANINVTGLGTEGVDWNYLYTNVGGRDLTQIQVIPEPSSTALLGLGGLALVLRRRK